MFAHLHRRSILKALHSQWSLVPSGSHCLRKPEPFVKWLHSQSNFTEPSVFGCVCLVLCVHMFLLTLQNKPGGLVYLLCQSHTSHTSRHGAGWQYYAMPHYSKPGNVYKKNQLACDFFSTWANRPLIRKGCLFWFGLFRWRIVWGGRG